MGPCFNGIEPSETYNKCLNWSKQNKRVFHGNLNTKKHIGPNGPNYTHIGPIGTHFQIEIK